MGPPYADQILWLGSLGIGFRGYNSGCLIRKLIPRLILRLNLSMQQIKQVEDNVTLDTIFSLLHFVFSSEIKIYDRPSVILKRYEELRGGAVPKYDDADH